MRRIIPKRDELFSFINDITADVVILTETWLREDIIDTEVFPSNLNSTIFHRDRESKREGGVLIAITNTPASSLKFHDDKIEFTWALVSNGASKFVFGACYWPPDSHPDFCHLLHQFLLTVTNKYPKAPYFYSGTSTIEQSAGRCFQCKMGHCLKSNNF